MCMISFWCIVQLHVSNSVYDNLPCAILGNKLCQPSQLLPYEMFTPTTSIVKFGSVWHVIVGSPIEKQDTKREGKSGSTKL